MLKKIEYWLCGAINIILLLSLYWPFIQWFDKRVDETFEAQGITTAIILSLCGLINLFIIRIMYRNEPFDVILMRLFKTTIFVILMCLIILIFTGIVLLTQT